MLLAMVIASTSFVFAADTIQTESVIVFNTACARCHEGECSGRMTFNLPKSATNQHIRRHGGELADESVRQLFEVLRYMKEECGFYPLSMDLAKDKVWGNNLLAKLRSPSNQAYFVPLGFLEPGSYRLMMTGLAPDTNYCIEIINSEFDYFDNKRVNGDGEETSLIFQADVRSEYFLRISAREPVSLKKIELLPDAGN